MAKATSSFKLGGKIKDRKATSKRSSIRTPSAVTSQELRV